MVDFVQQYPSIKAISMITLVISDLNSNHRKSKFQHCSEEIYVTFPIKYYTKNTTFKKKITTK